MNCPACDKIMIVIPQEDTAFEERYDCDQCGTVLGFRFIKGHPKTFKWFKRKDIGEKHAAKIE